ncbi:thiamine pyrophosphokinase [Ruminiclostridium sufflavum DSM 19573]|uniref:Thiamine diphosphokinase n=1 Tax=Ruminiclostridium sufflavum DSM 19573 TaxID=1121337 RepID=A0A318XJE5_9FIRM|nr:thiamine diphosphokinase [Ruminiclostridium sufflavum]PYG87389.1 thiamine pyrophosphokinase [Ruminiclostridium sufflavum DSM 19573]
MKAFLVCNGSIRDYNEIKKHIGSGGYIISVDGGAGHLRKMGIEPDILIGDFDSAASEDLRYFADRGVSIFKFPPEKDMTDSELAIEKAAEIGAEELVFIGALGSRADHSFANMLLLKKCLDIGIRACILDENNQIYMFNSTFTLGKQAGYKLSLIPVSERVTGVTTYGLRYRLHNATMLLGTSWGVSNEFLEDNVTVALDKGLLLACVSRD